MRSPSSRQRIREMELESQRVPFDAYVAKFEESGGIVEQRIAGVELRSPSVQLRIVPDGSIELLSTHDQLLGGPKRSAVPRLRLPRGPGVRSDDQQRGDADRRPSSPGAGCWAASPSTSWWSRSETGDWTPFAIELNLRKGGTTHPFLTLQYLTGGSYDAESATFRTPAGAPRYLVATDHLESDALRALSLDDFFDVVASHGLQFDKSHDTGVVFHMMSCLTEIGRLGLTAVGESPEHTWELYQRAQTVLLDEAARAQRPPALPS